MEKFNMSYNDLINLFNKFNIVELNYINGMIQGLYSDFIIIDEMYEIDKSLVIKALFEVMNNYNRNDYDELVSYNYDCVIYEGICVKANNFSENEYKLLINIISNLEFLIHETEDFVYEEDSFEYSDEQPRLMELSIFKRLLRNNYFNKLDNKKLVLNKNIKRA